MKNPQSTLSNTNPIQAYTKSTPCSLLLGTSSSNLSNASLIHECLQTRLASATVTCHIESTEKIQRTEGVFFKSVDFSATRMMMTVPLTHPFAFSPVHLRPLLQHLRDSHGEHVVDLILLLAEPLPQQITLFSYSDR